MTEKVDYKISPQEWQKHLAIMEEMFPTMFYVPNVAQERFHMAWYEAPYPFLTMCTPGNGTGKTCMMVQDIAAVYLGPAFVNMEFVKGDYYSVFEKHRDKGKLRGRIVCKAEDVKEGGSVYEEVMQWIPSAKFTNKQSSGYYQKIIIPHPANPNIKNVLDIKTFDQEKTAHAGSNLHRIWMNEPPPPEVFGEEIGRTRSKAGEIQCHVLIFATVLDQAGYLWDIIDDPEMQGKVEHIEGCIWENCVGSEVPESVGRKLGLKKDENGSYITRGVLSRESIENQVSTWKRTCPQEAEAREWGKPMYLGQVAFPTFSPKVHVVHPFPVPKRYPIIQIVDPHPARPDFSGWAMITPLRELVFIHEWPNEPYETIKSRTLTISEMCTTWRNLEAEWGITNQIVGRYGDPNMFAHPDSNTLKTLQQLYSPHGFNFNIWIPDDVAYGHSKINEMLYYDISRWQENPEDPLNKPKLMFFETCYNLVRHMQKYGRKVNRDPTAPPSAQFDKKYEDGAKVVQYGVVSFIQACGLKTAEESGGALTDYEKMRNARDKYRKGRSKTRIYKGRRIVYETVR